MSAITPAQIRGACGMLDWSKIDLAKATGLSVSVILSAAGRDPGRVSWSAFEAIRSALAAAGIDFLDGGGIGVRPREHQPSVFSRFL